MRQVIQNYRTGVLDVVEVPAPSVRAGSLVIRTATSLVSTGTERYLVDMAQKSLLGKALARPDLVRHLIAKAQTEGILEAFQQAVGRLDTPVPLGYSSAGVVIDVAPGVEGFVIGDRVACAGSAYASHAEAASVPANHCVKIPDNVNFESAAFVALGGVALESMRMAQVSLGETVVVIGLGLLGQIAVQLLKAAGCHVIGMDINSQKTEMAAQHGAEAVAADYHTVSRICQQLTTNHGADAVIIFAATPSNEPLEQAAELCRERGRIVASGMVGLEIPRKSFYDKELGLVVSRAWGPGLYEPNYTEKGLDYPIAYARWTAGRNIEEFLRVLAKGVVRVDHLITHRFPLERAKEAYELILEEKEPYIAVLLTYPQQISGYMKSRVVWLEKNLIPSKVKRERIGIGLIGSGLFAKGTLLPVIKRIKDIRFRGIATATGLSVHHTGKKFGFEYCATDHCELLADPEIDLVFILTRHGSHASLVTEAIRAGKHVFVEKPLALNVWQLSEIVGTFNDRDCNSQPALMVGFNRRFSPFSRWLKERFSVVGEPLAIHCTVNAGLVPPDHWVHDPEVGGGRIIGEVCHFVDLIQYLSSSVPMRVYAETLSSDGYKHSDNVVVTLKMANGAIGSIHYVAGGDKRYPRERVEVFGGGAVGVIQNFREATFTRGGARKRIRNWLSIDRGHSAEIQALGDTIRNGSSPPVALEEYLYTTLSTFAIEESLRRGVPIAVVLGALNPVEQ